MGQNYYIPLSSFVLPEIASAEAISPTNGDISGLFVGRNSYPTETTGSIPVNPASEILIVYSEPIIWEYTDSRVMDYPLVIKVSESLLDIERLEKLALPSLPQEISAWAYPKTIFFRSLKGVKFLFRSNEEMHQQIRRISQYQEVKIYPFVNDLCESFEKSNISPVVLPNDIGKEILQEVGRLKLPKTDTKRDIQEECRTGACLGYTVGRFESKEIPIESLVDDIPCEIDRNKATQILDDLRKKMQNEIISRFQKTKEISYALNPITLTKRFVYRARAFVETWEEVEPILRSCIDFIAAYPPDSWNWVGNKERFEFVKALWNNILKEQEESTNLMKARNEANKICGHFNSPNSVRVSEKDISSPILQALYIVLLCEGEPTALRKRLKYAERIDYCLALYGAFKGYSYFSRSLIPDQLELASPIVPEPIVDDSAPEIVPGEKKPVAQSSTISDEEKINNEVDLLGEPIRDRKKAIVKKRGMTSPSGKYKMVVATDVNKRCSEGWTLGRKK